jgi:hypothetical protein
MNSSGLRFNDSVSEREMKSSEENKIGDLLVVLFLLLFPFLDFEGEGEIVDDS